MWLLVCDTTSSSELLAFTVSIQLFFKSGCISSGFKYLSVAPSLLIVHGGMYAFAKNTMKNFISVKCVLRLMTYGVTMIIYSRDYSAGNDHAKSTKQSDGGKQGYAVFGTLCHV